jgi:hypothetical protein
MTLRPEYSLGQSEYNAFLFAAVGEEKTGMQLTVQTALIRLGFDPWQEAARLSGLSKAAAVQALTAAMARLPEGDWNASALPEIAARLIGSLPGRITTQAAPPSPAKPISLPFGLPPVSFAAPKGMVLIALAGALLLGLLVLQYGNVFESAPADSAAVQTNNQYNK